jgi:predicted O-methyltransferase YrrM
LAKGLTEGGGLHTIEIDDELEAIARKYFIKSGLIRQITSHYGDAKIIIPTFNQSFDLVFIDADKREYSDYYRLVIDLVPIGGIIIADNILWNGKVVDTDSNSDAQTRNIIEFNDLVHNDDRIRNVILPIRDGMMILQKIR